MSISVRGTFQQAMQAVGGTGKNGNTWKKQSFLIATDGDYSKDVVFDAWGDKTDAINGLEKGTPIEVHFEPESREYNGKWYTNLRAWKITPIGASAPSTPAAPPAQPAAPSAPANDDLPF